MAALKEQGIERYARVMGDLAQSVLLDSATGMPRDTKNVSDQIRKQFDEVFRRFSAIYTSIENLDLCLKFIRARRPKRGRRNYSFESSMTL